MYCYLCLFTFLPVILPFSPNFFLTGQYRERLPWLNSTAFRQYSCHKFWTKICVDKTSLNLLLSLLFLIITGSPKAGRKWLLAKALPRFFIFPATKKKHILNIKFFNGIQTIYREHKHTYFYRHLCKLTYL